MIDALNSTECPRPDHLGQRPVADRNFLNVCCSNCGSILYTVLVGVAIRNLSMSPNVKMQSEYSLRCYHKVVIEQKRLRRKHSSQPTTETRLLNGVPSRTLQRTYFTPSPGQPEYYVIQNDE